MTITFPRHWSVWPAENDRKRGKPDRFDGQPIRKRDRQRRQSISS
jgi:hypothetical protein